MHPNVLCVKREINIPSRKHHAAERRAIHSAGAGSSAYQIKLDGQTAALSRH
jgi:hypothetical protein